MRERQYLGTVLIGWTIACGTAQVGCSTGSDGAVEPQARALSSAAAPRGPRVPDGMRATVRRVGATVEIEVTASSPFRTDAMPAVLVIGDQAFGRSWNPPDDGRPDTLIFGIDAADFDALPDGGEVSVGYLHPSARLIPRAPAGTARGAAARGGYTPEKVGPGRGIVGRLRKARMEIAP